MRVSLYLMFFINFKTYEQGSGQKAIKLARVLEGVSLRSQIKIIPVVQIIDAEMVVDSVRLDVWIQHIDPVSYGAHTGWTLPEEAVRVGVKGVFLNHSEHKFDDWDLLIKANARCGEVGLKTLVFAEDIEELKKAVELEPNFVSYEPPELVGSETTSVAEAKPELISEAVAVAREVNLPLIVGAGIKIREDVSKSLSLGVDGFAVASAVVKAEDPKSKLEELIEGFTK